MIYCGKLKKAIEGENSCFWNLYFKFYQLKVKMCKIEVYLYSTSTFKSNFLFFSGQGSNQSVGTTHNSWFSNSSHWDSQQEFQQTESRDNHGEFKCQICFKEYSYKHNLARHMKTHAGMRFSCPICDSKFTRLFTLKSHLKSVHSLLYCSGCFGTFGLNDSSKHRCPNLWTNSAVCGGEGGLLSRVQTVHEVRIIQRDGLL